MTTESSHELDRFRRFLDEQIESGCGDLTPEASLQLWRAHLLELNESVAAIKQALAEMEAGDTGQPLEAFADEFRNSK